MTSAARTRGTGRSSRARAAAPTPLEELRSDGRLGPHGAQRLYAIVRAVAIARGFPPPGGRGKWDTDAIAEVAHEFLADERTPVRLTHLVVHAVDNDSFDRLLHRIVLNYLRDQGRRTETGRLMRRLRDVLDGDAEFVSEPGDRWRLATQPSAPSNAAPALLTEAAGAERQVDVPRWSHQTRRRPPVADAASLVRLCRRVLEAATGTVALDELARSISPRLGLAPAPLVETIDDRDPFERIAAPQHADAGVDSMRAAEIFATLGERERLLLATAGTPVRELRSVIGLGPSQAAELQARLRAVLEVELRDDEHYETVFFHLIDQAKAWAAPHAAGRTDAIRRLVDMP